MNSKQETAKKFVQESLTGKRELNEEVVRALIQDEPELTLFLILEQNRRLQDTLVTYSKKAIMKNKKSHAAISISCLVEAIKSAFTAEVNSRPLAVS